jgi:hypothetical protein
MLKFLTVIRHGTKTCAEKNLERVAAAQYEQRQFPDGDIIPNFKCLNYSQDFYKFLLSGVFAFMSKEKKSEKLNK